MPRLEARRRTEVVGVGIDELAPRERGNHVWWSVAEPERGHVDEGAVVGLQRHAQVELEHAVATEKRPVAASREHLPSEPRALEAPVPDRGRHASTVRHGADPLYLGDCDVQRHQQLEIHEFAQSQAAARICPTSSPGCSRTP